MSAEATEQRRGGNAKLIAAVAFLGALLVLGVTHRWGIGCESDSESYLMAARSLANGHGLSLTRDGGYVPMTAFPPLYPLLLDSLAWANVDAAVTGRWVSALLFGAMLALVGVLIQGNTEASRAASLIGMAIVGTSYNVLQVYGYLLSEQLFLVLLLVWLVALSGYLKTGRRIDFWTMVVVVAAACLARYAGVALIASGAIMIACLSGQTRRRKVEDATGLVLLSSLPLVLWMIRNVASGASATGRPPGLKIAENDALRLVGSRFASWLVPDVVTGALRALGFFVGFSVLLIGVIATWRLWRTKRTGQHEIELDATERCCLVFALVYACILGLTMIASNPEVAADSRLLVPLQVVLVVVAVIFVARVYKNSQRKGTARIMLGAAVAGMLVLNSTWAGAWSVWKFRNGSGFVSRKWLANGLVEGVRRLPQSAAIYTNHPGAIYCMTARPGSMLPGGNGIRSVVSKHAEFLAMRDTLQKRGGAIVIFPWVSHEGMVSEAEIEQALSPICTQRAPNGIVYFFSPSGRRSSQSSFEEHNKQRTATGASFAAASRPVGTGVAVRSETRGTSRDR